MAPAIVTTTKTVKRVVILAHRNRGYEIESLVRELRALGFLVEVCHPKKFTIVMGLNSIIMYDKKPFTIPDLLFVRTGSGTGSYSNVVISQMEQMGCLVVNPSSAIKIAMDKILTMQRLALAGVAIPTTLIQFGKNPVKAWIEHSGGEWCDCVAKEPVGSHGAVVQVCRSKSVLKGWTGLQRALNPKQPILIQNRVDGEEVADIRVILIGGRAFGAMKRIAEPGLDITGISSGGHGEPCELTPELIEISEKAGAAIGLTFLAGIDLMKDKEGNIFCLEGNSAPGFVGFDQYCDANIAREIAQYVESLLVTKH
jgi:gamma-F420-2:alpha-L-glutamate ligase